MEKIFEGIGGKIKTLSKNVLVIGIIMSIVSWIGWLLVADEASWRYEDTFLIIAWLSLFVGLFTSWAVSLLVHGFGEMIEKNNEIAENIRELNQTAKPHSSGWVAPGINVDVKDIEANLPEI